MNTVEIRVATPNDQEQVWSIIKNTIQAGDTYVFEPNSPRKEMLEYWFDPSKHTFVAEENGSIIGTYILKDNQPGLGSHVANASYMVAAKVRGKGLGELLARHSLVTAKSLGYLSIQFNIVVKTNRPAIRLWEKLDFKIVGEVPGAFRLPSGEYETALIMFRPL